MKKYFLILILLFILIIFNYNNNYYNSKYEEFLNENTTSAVDNSVSKYYEILNKIGNINRKQKDKRVCRYEYQVQGDITNINNNELTTSININDISVLNNFIIFFVYLTFDNLMDILDIEESELSSIDKRNYEHFLDNLNVLIKKKIELSDVYDIETNKNLWISKKYKLVNKNSNLGKLIINEKLYYKLDSTPISTNYGEMIIGEYDSIERKSNGISEEIKIPYEMLIKWFIPNPLANLSDCLIDLELKNKDREGYFNI